MIEPKIHHERDITALIVNSKSLSVSAKLVVIWASRANVDQYTEKHYKHLRPSPLLSCTERTLAYFTLSAVLMLRVTV